MSTLNVNIIKSQSTSAPAIQNSSGTEVGQFVKAWGTFDGTATVGKLSTFNFSSITDLGVGYYRLSFENNMPDTNYAIAGNAIKGDQNDDGNQILQAGGNNVNPQLNVGSFNVRTKVASNNNNIDCDKFHVIVIR